MMGPVVDRQMLGVHIRTNGLFAVYSVYDEQGRCDYEFQKINRIQYHLWRFRRWLASK